jgi:HEAT repeat protein
LVELEDPEALKLLVKHVRETTAARQHAIVAIGRLGPRAVDATQVLITALRDDIAYYQKREQKINPSYICSTVNSLGNIGPGAAEAVPFLKDIMKHSRGELSVALSEALVKIDRSLIPEVTATLRAIITDRNAGPSGVHVSAARVLGMIGPEFAPEAVAVLCKPIRSRASVEPSDVSSALEALEHIGPLAKDAVTVITANLLAPDDDLFAEAAHVLGTIGPASKGAVEALQRATHDHRATVREAAQDAIRRIDTSAAAPAERRANNKADSNPR